MIKQPSLSRLFERIDAVNGSDLRTVWVRGERIPFELAYGHRMSDSLLTFEANASLALQVAARAQHIGRFEVPRNLYPEGRSGYLKWRTYLYGFHADRVATLMREEGFEEELIERVRFLVLKKGVKSDPEAQVLEDVICLVFLAFYFQEFAAQHSREKVIAILQKTWSKMSDKGHQAALSLSFDEVSLSLIQTALGG